MKVDPATLEADAEEAAALGDILGTDDRSAACKAARTICKDAGEGGATVVEENDEDDDIIVSY